MIAVEEKQIDAWLEWEPKWAGLAPTPYDLQEKHSPSERVSDDNQRRIVDARLWDGMSVLQQEAAMEIAHSFEMVHNGSGYKTSNWQRIPTRSTGNMSDARADLVNVYFEWARKCTVEKISHAMIIDVLCFGHACRSVDAARRVKNGTTQKYLLRGLSLYCEVRGWL